MFRALTDRVGAPLAAIMIAALIATGLGIAVETTASGKLPTAQARN